MELLALSKKTAPDRSQLQQIIAGLTEGVILLEPDQTITYANDAALEAAERLTPEVLKRIDEIVQTKPLMPAY